MPFELTYRTNAPLLWGPGKGSNLLPAEVDQNFYNLETRVQAVETNPILPAQIMSIDVVGNRMTITMDDYSTFGPFLLPVATLGNIGPFEPNHEYETFDLVTASSGLYLVLHPFLSGPTFVFGSDIDGPWYQFLMPFPDSYSFGLFYPGQPGFGIEADRAMFQHAFSLNAYLPVGLAGSIAELEDAPADDLSFPIMHGVDLIGSIDFGAYDKIGTFTFATAEQFVPPEKIRVLRPTVLDAAARDLTVTFLGKLGTL